MSRGDFMDYRKNEGVSNEWMSENVFKVNCGVLLVN